MARIVMVVMDNKGRVRIPASLRREVKARRFTVSLEEGRIVTKPVKSPDSVREKYMGILKVPMEGWSRLRSEWLRQADAELLPSS